MRTDRDVVAHAMNERREQLTGEASPIDYSGAHLVLLALEKAGYSITKTDDGAAVSGPTHRPAVSPPAPSSPIPRLFQLVRHVDISGVSGVGVVAEGAEWRDGSVSLRWYGDHPSTVAWPSVGDIVAVHGHEGATEVRWFADIPIDYWPTEGATR